MSIQSHIDTIRNGGYIDWFLAQEIADSVALSKGDYLAKRVVQLMDDIQASEAVLELVGPSQTHAGRSEFARWEVTNLLERVEVDGPKSEALVTLGKKELQALSGLTPQGMTKRYKSPGKWGYFNIKETTVDITESAYWALINAKNLRT